LQKPDYASNVSAGIACKCQYIVTSDKQSEAGSQFHIVDPLMAKIQNSRYS